jgi:predicted permease
VGVQIALCTFLLAIAGLFVRTFDRLRAVDPGFDRLHVATFMLDLMGSGITNDGEATLRRRLLEAVRAIPGVEAAGISSVGVMRGHGMIATVVPEGRQPTSADYLNTYSNSVSPGYFETMGIRLLEGRSLTERDAPPLTPSDKSVVVNEAFARLYFPGVDPIGKRVVLGKLHHQIVGVVSDSKYRSVREPIHPTIYGIGSAFETFVLNVRTKMRPELMFPAVDSALTSIDPSLSFLESQTLSAQVDESLAAERLEAAVATFFGAMAALLAGIGTYGLLAQTVAQRYREIGIRMALGARAFHIQGLIGRQILLLTAVGMATGLWASLLAGRWMKSLVYGISASDPVSLGASAFFIAAIAVVAAVLPARRAISIAPAETLRLDN